MNKHTLIQGRRFLSLWVCVCVCILFYWKSCELFLLFLLLLLFHAVWHTHSLHMLDGASCRQVTKNGECDSGWKQASSGTASENVFHAEVLHYLARSKWPVRGRVSQQPMEFISIPYTTRASARSARDAAPSPNGTEWNFEYLENISSCICDLYLCLFRTVHGTLDRTHTFSPYQGLDFFFVFDG